MKYRKIMLSLAAAVALSIFATACVDEPQNGLFINGAPAYKSGDCTSFATDGYTFSGAYDLNVYEYGGPLYTINLKISNILPSNAMAIRGRAEENWVVMRRFKIEFQLPESWPSDIKIEPVYYDRTVHLDPGDEWYLSSIEVFSEKTIKTLNEIYDNAYEGVTADRPQPLMLKITAEGEDSGGNSIESNAFYYRVNICRGCMIYKSVDTCCCSPYNTAPDSQSCVQSIMDDGEDQGLCNLYQDRPMIYCSWLPGCYQEIQCNQCTCSNYQCTMPEESTGK